MNSGLAIYGTEAPAYLAWGLVPLPIRSATKAPSIANWQNLTPHSPELARLIASHAEHGIGLLMGSSLPDGTALGAVDIDNDLYRDPVCELLGNPPSGRIGKKGAVFFVRVRGPLSNPEFRVKNDVSKRWGKVVECLFTKKVCVIPPTIHPDTGQPYRWIGKPLLQTDFSELPIVEMDK